MTMQYANYNASFYVNNVMMYLAHYQRIFIRNG